MSHGHHQGCCGHSHGSTHGGCGGSCCKSKGAGITIDQYELAILKELLEYNFLPISRFVMCSSHADKARFVALAPVYIFDESDSMAEVKSFAERLKTMQEKNLISLDYDVILQGYDYERHRSSDLFRYFARTVKDGAQKPGFLCDVAELECGSIALTPFGRAAAGKFFGRKEAL